MSAQPGTTDRVRNLVINACGMILIGGIVIGMAIMWAVIAASNTQAHDRLASIGIYWPYVTGLLGMGLNVFGARLAMRAIAPTETPQATPANQTNGTPQ
jgi:TRAP-type C4-dicarboxylate transport system permease small subunit